MSEAKRRQTQGSSAVASATAAPLDGEAHIYRRSTAGLAPRSLSSQGTQPQARLPGTWRDLGCRPRLRVSPMRRREFIGLIGGAGLVWPFAAHAQPSGPVRRIGVLMNRAANDPEGQARLAALQQGLEQAGWSIGRNVQIDLRWGEDDLDLEAKHAAELVALAPDLIFASGTLSVAAVKRLS